MQPPSGGCVLKQKIGRLGAVRIKAAAFGRLCVETTHSLPLSQVSAAAAFGRLCVETTHSLPLSQVSAAAAFGRLCVETANDIIQRLGITGSRLRAAVC